MKKTYFRMFFLTEAGRRSERGNETQNLFCNKAKKIHGFMACDLKSHSFYTFNP